MESFYNEREVTQIHEFLALWKALFKKLDPYTIVSQFDRTQKHLQIRNKLANRVLLLEAPIGSGITTFLNTIFKRFQLSFDTFDGSQNQQSFELVLNNFINFQQGIVRRKKPYILVIENHSLINLNYLNNINRIKGKRPFLVVVITNDAFQSTLRQIRQNSVLIRLQINDNEVKKVLQNYAPGGIIATQILQNQFAQNLEICNKFNTQDISTAVLTRKSEFLLQKRDIPLYQGQEILRKQHIILEYGTASSFITLAQKLGLTDNLALKSLEKASKSIFELPFLSTYQTKKIKQDSLNYDQFVDMDMQFNFNYELSGIPQLNIMQDLSCSQSIQSPQVALFSLHAHLQQTSFVKPITSNKIYRQNQYPIFTHYEITQSYKLAYQSLFQRCLQSFSSSSIYLSNYDLQLEVFQLITETGLQNYVGTLSDQDKYNVATSSTGLAELGFLKDKNGYLVLSDDSLIVLTENAKRAVVAAVDGLFHGNKLSEDIYQLVINRFSTELQTFDVIQEYTFHQGVTLAVRLTAKFKDFF